MRAVLLGAVALLFAACMGVADRMGQVPLAYSEARAAQLEQPPLPLVEGSVPQTVEEGVEELKKRPPIEKKGEPRIVRDLGRKPVAMSIADFRLAVLSNNLDLAVARFAPEFAAQKTSEEIGKFDAVIGGRIAYKETDTPERDSDLVRLDSLTDNPLLEDEVVKFTEVEQQKELSELGVGIEIPTPLGAKVKLETSLSQKEVLGPGVFEEYVGGAKFSISAPLLRNGGTDFNLAPIRIARAGERIAQVKTKLKALRVLAKAEKSYWKLYQARQELEIRSEQLRLAEGQLRIVRDRVGQGLNRPIEIARAEAGVADRIEGLIIAEQRWIIAQRRLKAFLADENLPLNGEPVIDITTDPMLVRIEPDRDLMVRSALRERLELIEIELRLVQDDLLIRARENQILPIANLDFSYGLIDRQDTYTEAFGDAFDGDNNELSIGLNFAIPVTNQRARARLEQSVVRRAARYASKQARMLQVEREVHDALDVLFQNWQRIAAARQNVVVSGRLYELEQDQFLQGFRTQTEVFEALSKLGDSQLKELKAIVDYQVSQIDIAFATGTLLGYAGVEVEPLRLNVGR